MVFSPKVLPDCNFNQSVLLVTTIFPLSPSELKQFVSPSCMEDYFVIEFPACGGEIGLLNISADLGH